MGDCFILNRQHDWLPEFTYTGSYELVEESKMADAVNRYWKIRFLTSGNLTFIQPNSANRHVDIFLVGGGGGGNHSSYWPYGGGGEWGAFVGGAGGVTLTARNLAVERRVTYSITVGAGGSGSSGNGGASSFVFPSKTYTAAGGTGGTVNSWVEDGSPTYSAAGGNGGSGGAAHANEYNGWFSGYASNGANGPYGGYNITNVGKGQGTNPGTREFWESSGTLYAYGGGPNSPRGAHTGNGGWYSGGGDSGIVIMRLHR